MKITSLFALLAIITMVSCTNKQSKETANPDCIWLIGSSVATEEENGVSVYCFNQETGEAKLKSSIKGISNPTYFDISQDGSKIYTVGENGKSNSSAYYLDFDTLTGNLAIKDSVKVNGASPCYITISPDEKYIVTANYMGANISVVPIGNDGKFTNQAITYDYSGVGIDTIRQTQPHLHCVRFLPNDQRLIATDLGLDRIHTFNVDTSTDNTSKPYLTKGTDIIVDSLSGPRHIEFDAKGKYAYLINELSGMVTVFDINDSILVAKQYIVSDTVHAMGSGDIHLSPDNKYLYTSNRLESEGLAIFRVDPVTGLLTRIGSQPTGRHPRNFAITPNGKFVLVACRDDNQVEIYSRDESTGLLTDTNRRINLNKPVCLKFNPKYSPIMGECINTIKSENMNQKETSFKSIDVPRISTSDEITNQPYHPISEVNWKEYATYPETYFQIATIDNNICIKFTTKEANPLAVNNKDFQSVWEDSCVEFFCKVPSEEKYFNFEFNSNKACMASSRLGRDEDVKFLEVQQMESISRKVIKNPNEWSLTVMIPLSIIDPNLTTPCQLKGNFYKCGDKCEHPHFLSWNPISTPTPDFHCPSYFGTINLL